MAQKGAILNCHDISLLPRVFQRLSEQENDQVISILIDVVNKSQIQLCHVCDNNGNNAMHLLFLNIISKWNRRLKRKQKHRKHKTDINLQTELDTLKMLYENVEPKWMFEKNKNNDIPVAMLFDTTKWQVDDGQSLNVFENDDIMHVIFRVLMQVVDLVQKDSR